MGDEGRGPSRVSQGQLKKGPEDGVAWISAQQLLECKRDEHFCATFSEHNQYWLLGGPANLLPRPVRSDSLCVPGIPFLAPEGCSHWRCPLL